MHIYLELHWIPWVFSPTEKFKLLFKHNHTHTHTHTHTIRFALLVTHHHSLPNPLLLSSAHTHTQHTTHQVTHRHRGEYETSATRQFATLARRSLMELLRDKAMTRMRMIAHVVCAVLLGLIYLHQGTDASEVHNILGFLFFSLLFLMLAAVMPTVLTYPTEKEIFIREHLNNWYRIKAYYLAKFVVDLPLQVRAFVFVCLFACDEHILFLCTSRAVCVCVSA